MNKITIYLYIIITSIISYSCIQEEVLNNNPKNNFEALWKIIDEHYCFLDYKNREYGLDWNKIHKEYSNRITSSMTSKQLFDVLSDMVNELRDGHVNLSSDDRVSQYREWFDNYPRNFSDSIQSIYLKKDYNYVSGLKYQRLQQNIGYVYCESFQYSIGNSNLDQILDYMSICDGLIIDVRNNGGGNLTSAETLASRFTNEKILTGYIQHKTGPGHNSFSEPKAIYIDPPHNRVRWQKPVVVLTNRRSFSATNDFVNSMRHMSKAIIIGDNTGGGSGLPYTSELPNGWSIRFSASPMLGSDKSQLEFGIEPDIKIDISSDDYSKGVDTIIEKAIEIIKKQKK